ncbi:MAG: class I SAM-dependent methyltransferase [Desulfobacteraceae bacterium]|nr:class I SAM-dependent methyltransferase [Desulfobacteraceae bacterium]
MGGLNTEDILRKTLRRLKKSRLPKPARILDIGSGHGDLIALMRKSLPCETFACDCTASLMRLPDQEVSVIDLNREGLPFPDAYFDAVTCTEVVEHLENFRHMIKEVGRTVKPGGVAVLTTPNVLNLKSRVKFFASGFFNLFGPLPSGNRQSATLQGHITPVSFFYLAHSLMENGFAKIELHIDKVNKSSACLLLPAYLPIRLMNHFVLGKEQRRYHSIDEGNRRLVRSVNGLKTLLGRTIIVTATKKT